jgi:hypothetical protein
MAVAFRQQCNLDDSQIGQELLGVYVDTGSLPIWGILPEINDPDLTTRNRTFTLRQANQTERYYLTVPETWGQLL